MNYRSTGARKRMHQLAPVAVLAIAATALQVGAADADAPSNSSRAIQETIVTARRQAENIQDVPLSVTAFSDEDIARVAPRTLRDFDGLSPNVRIGMNTAGPSAAAIRWPVCGGSVR